MGSEGEVWRVYLPEWLIVYTSVWSGADGYHECEAVIRERYTRTDFRIVAADHDHRKVVPPDWPAHRQCCIQVLLPNLRGEFTTEEDADRLIHELGETAVAVVRDSSEDKAIQRKLQL